MHSKFCLSLTWDIVFSAEAWICLGSALVIFSLRSLFSSGISPVFCAMNPWSSAMLFCFHFHSCVAFLVKVGASYQITDFRGRELKRQANILFVFNYLGTPLLEHGHVNELLRHPWPPWNLVITFVTRIFQLFQGGQIQAPYWPLAPRKKFSLKAII